MDLGHVDLILAFHAFAWPERSLASAFLRLPGARRRGVDLLILNTSLLQLVYYGE